MCRLIEAINSVGEAADTLTRACARKGAVVDSATANDNPLNALLRRSFRTTAVNPADMTAFLRRMK